MCAASCDAAECEWRESGARHKRKWGDEISSDATEQREDRETQHSENKVVRSQPGSTNAHVQNSNQKERGYNDQKVTIPI